MSRIKELELIKRFFSRLNSIKTVKNQRVFISYVKRCYGL